MSSRTNISCSEACCTSDSMFSIPFSLSIRSPNAVGLIDKLASKFCSTIACMTRTYSSRKYCASSREEISSPKTSIVKQAPSDSSRFMTLTASSSVGPATYLLETHRTNQRGMRSVIATMSLDSMMTPLGLRLNLASFDHFQERIRLYNFNTKFLKVRINELSLPTLE